MPSFQKTLVRKGERKMVIISAMVSSLEIERNERKRNAKCRVKADRKVCFGLTMKKQIGKGKPIGMMDPRGQGQYHVMVPVVKFDFFYFFFQPDKLYFSFR
jgi:hypothetical protein